MAKIGPSLEELAERTAAQEAAEAAREAEELERISKEENKKNDEIDDWNDLVENKDEEWREIFLDLISGFPMNELSSLLDNIQRVAPILKKRIYEKHPGLKEAREIAPENAKPLTGYLWDALESRRKKQPEYKTISLSDIVQAAWSTDGAETGEYKELLDQAKEARGKKILKDRGKLKPREQLKKDINPAYMNDIVTRKMMEGELSIEGDCGVYSENVDIFGENKEKTCYVPITVQCLGNGEDGISFTRPLNGLKCAIISVIGEQWKEEKRMNPNLTSLTISVNEIWRKLVKEQSLTRHPSRKMYDLIVQCIDEMRHTDTYIDSSNEILNYKKLGDPNIYKPLKKFMLNAEWVDILTQTGRIIPALEVYNEPVLYEYNDKKNHLVYTDKRYLDIRPSMDMTIEAIVFRNYLAAMITQMKKGYRKSNRILFDTIYTQAGIDPPENRGKNIKEQRRKDRNTIKAILNAYKEKEFIIDYNSVKKGRAIIGVDINFSPLQVKAVNSNT